jgi:hypothetical protein
MENVLYLVHAVGDDKYNNWDELKISSINEVNHQYPGVYFTLITKDNIKTENLYNFKNLLIFSKKLLEQENYHINLNDYNGFINEKNTYFPWNLDKAVKKIKYLSKKNKYGIGNEVIFHDSIPMKYLCLVINSKSIDYNIASKNNVKYGSLLLPPYELYNEELPDMTKIPFYCIPLEDNYTGINKFKLSSKNFYKKMAILCNVNINQSRNKIIEDIKNKIIELYNDRKKQNIEKFKFLTN